MDPHDDDDDLKQLLRQWQAPAPPDRLRRRVFGESSAARWAWLLTGSVRVPVPLVAAFALLLVWLVVGRGPDVVQNDVSSPAPVSLADFHPPAEMRVRVVGALP